MKKPLKELFFGVLILLMCILNLGCKNEYEIELIKSGEIVLEFPNYKQEKVAKMEPFEGRRYTPGFAPSFLITSNGFMWIRAYGYFSEYMIIDINTGECEILNNLEVRNSKEFSPGAISGVSVFSDGYVVINNVVKAMIYKENGEFDHNIILPPQHSAQQATKKFNDLILTSSSFGVSKLNTKKIDNEYIESFSKEQAFELMRKTIPSLHSGYSHSFDMDENGILCYVSPIKPNVFVFSLNDNKLIANIEEVPPHYISIYDLEPFLTDDSIEDKNDPEALKDWQSKFAFTGYCFVHNKDYFIVQRWMRPPHYLDFYSIREKKYMGSYKTEKPLMYANKDFIYLHGGFDKEKKELIIEKYRFTENNRQKMRLQKKGKKTKRVTININLEDTYKEMPPHWDPYSQVQKLDEFEQKTPVKSIKGFKVTGLDGEEHQLMDYLDKNKKYHFLIFARAEGNRLYNRYIDWLENEFLPLYDEFDYKIVLAWKDKEELERCYRFFGSEGKVIPILDLEKIFYFYRPDIKYYLGKYWYPQAVMSVVDNEGKVLHHIQDDLSVEYFEKVLKLSK